MADAELIHGNVYRNSAPVFMARIVGANNVNAQQADFSLGDGSSSSGECVLPIAYSVYLIDDQDSNSLTAVSGFENVEIAVADVIFDTLQTDNGWTQDSTGYNFKHQMPACPNSPFTTVGRRYRVEYTFQPDAGEPIVLVYQVNVI